MAPTIDILQRTMSGWLHKRGGKLGNKGWDKRWFVLENGQLQFVDSGCGEEVPDLPKLTRPHGDHPVILRTTGTKRRWGLFLCGICSAFSPPQRAAGAAKPLGLNWSRRSEPIFSG
jgi:hypothetical protein